MDSVRPPEMTAPALLKSPEGKLLERGAAVVSLENRTVDFISDFVQLFKMDTPLQIVLLKDDRETQSFSGPVYLSSQTMLRLVDVSDKILPGAKTAYLCEVSLPGMLRAPVAEEVRAGFMGLRRKTITGEQIFPVHIHSLSMQYVHFTSEKALEKGRLVRLQLKEPPIKEVVLEIEKALDFGQSAGNYHCAIRELRPAARMELDRYVGQLCEQQFKLF